MATERKSRKKPEPAKGTRKEDRSHAVLHHRCTIATDPYVYQVELLCKELGWVVLKPKSAAKFTALVALLSAGIEVRYWPYMARVGINSQEPGPRRR
jgi:hypothetical protein